MTEEEVSALLANMPDRESAARTEARMGPRKPLEQHLATLDSRGAYTTAQKPPRARRGNPEARLVQAIRKALVDAGYRVYRINQQWVQGAVHIASDAGVGDIVIGKPRHPLTLSCEVKTENGIISVAQAIAIQEGFLHVVSTPEDALALADRFFEVFT